MRWFDEAIDVVVGGERRSLGLLQGEVEVELPSRRVVLPA